MAKREAWELKQMQAVPLEGKIIMTKRRIREWYDHFDGQVYVSFSGGKDSTVLKHIVDSMIDDVPAVFVNTGLEYPEIQNFVRNVKSGKYDCFNTDVEILRPEMQFTEVLKKYGYPVVSKEVAEALWYSKKWLQKQGVTQDYLKFAASIEDKFTMPYRITQLLGTFETNWKEKKAGLIKRDGQISKIQKKRYGYLLDAPFTISHFCCNEMKKKPFAKYEKLSSRVGITAQMADESAQRRRNWMSYGCNAFSKKHPISNPMSFWTEQDVLHYIKKYNVPYASVYGDIVLKEPDDTLKGQMNITDYLGINACDPLETTGCNRTGCIFCMFGCHLENEPNRFQRLKQTHPKQYDYCINGGEMVNGKWQPNKEGLGLGHVLDYIGVKY